MQCKVCGCTEDKPCVTPEGPCHWAMPGICSECIVEIPPGEHYLREFKGGLLIEKRCRCCAKLQEDKEAETMGFKNYWRCSEGRFDYSKMGHGSIIPGCFAWSGICRPGKAVAAAQRKCPFFEVHPKWRRREVWFF